MLAIYEGAEIVLKPVFGAISDRVGARRVLILGLVAFAIASAAFALAGEPEAIALARLGQGAAAAAFSPAAGALLAASRGAQGRGRSFGGYGAAKGIGYVMGPLLGGVIVAASGFKLLFAVLALAALVVAVLAALWVPRARVTVRHREGLGTSLRRVSHANFLIPTAALAGGTGALSAAIGFIPARALSLDLSAALSGAAVSLMAGIAAVLQRPVGRSLDRGWVDPYLGIQVGMGLCALGFASLALLASAAGFFATAILVGAGVALLTPIGFAEVARTAPAERKGLTLGAAEVGRELGDAGGPLIVGGFAAFGLGTGALAALLGLGVGLRRPRVAESAGTRGEV